MLASLQDLKAIMGTDAGGFTDEALNLFIRIASNEALHIIGTPNWSAGNIPEDVSDLVLVAANEIRYNPANLASRTEGPYSENYKTPDENRESKYFTASEIKKLRKYSLVTPIDDEDFDAALYLGIGSISVNKVKYYTDPNGPYEAIWSNVRL